MDEIPITTKYQDILKTAHDLFWKYGYRRVSIEEICREAKASKMTFYRFFPNKLELAKAVFDSVIDESLLKFRKIIKEDSVPSEKMKKMLLMKFEETENISKEFLQDFYNNPELGLNTYIEEKSAAIWSEIISDFKRAQNDGWIRKDFKVEFLFYFVQKTTDIITDENLLKLYNSPQEVIMELTNLLVHGMTPYE
jgi:AcrR family transcriptional regulator